MCLSSRVQNVAKAEIEGKISVYLAMSDIVKKGDSGGYSHLNGMGSQVSRTDKPKKVCVPPLGAVSMVVKVRDRGDRCPLQGNFFQSSQTINGRMEIFCSRPWLAMARDGL